MSTENDLEDFLAPGCSRETNSVLPLSPKSHSSGPESIDYALMEAMDSIIESSRRTTNDITPKKRRRKSTGTDFGAKSPKSAKEGKEERYISAKIGLLCETNLHVSKDTPIAVQCDSCDKWRRLGHVEEDFQVPKVWFCWQNADTSHKTCSTEEEVIPGNEYCMSPFQPGSIVWAQVAGYPSWPAMIEDDPECLEFYEKEDDQNGEVKFTKYHVTFFDDTVTMAWVPVRNVKRFLKITKVPKLSSKYRKRYGTRFNKAVNEANKAMDMLLKERLLKYSFAIRHKGAWGLVPISILGRNRDGLQSTLDETKLLMDIIESLPDDFQILKDDLKNDASKKGLIVKASVFKGKKRKKMLKDDDDYGGEIFEEMDTGAYDVGGQDDVEKRKTDLLSNGINVEERKDAEADKVKNTMKGKKVNVVSEVAEMEKIVEKEKDLKTEDTDSKRSHVDKKSLTSKFSLTKREKKKKMLEKDIGTVHLNHETKQTNHDDEVNEVCGEKFQDESEGIFEETNTEVYNGGQEKVDKQMGKTGSDINVEKEESAGAGKVRTTMEWKKDNVVSSVAKVEETVKNNKKIENVGKKDLTFKRSLEKVETEVWQAKETKKKRASKAKEEIDKVVRAMKKDVESKVIKMEKASKKDGKQKIKSSINEEAVDTVDAKVNKEMSLEEKKKMNDKDHGRFTTKNFKTVICPTSPLKVDKGGFPRRNKLFKPPVIKLDVDAPLNDSEKKSPIAPQPSEISSTEPSTNNNGLGASGIGLCYPDHVDIMSWDAITKVPVNDGIVQKPSDEPILNKEPPFAVDEDTGFHFGDTEDVFFYGEGKKEMRMIDDVCNDPGDKELMDFDASPMIEAGVNSDPFDYD